MPDLARTLALRQRRDAAKGNKPWDSTIVEAASRLVMLDIAVLDAEVANSMYKKPITEMAKEIRYERLPEAGGYYSCVEAWRTVAESGR